VKFLTGQKIKYPFKKPNVWGANSKSKIIFGHQGIPGSRTLTFCRPYSLALVLLPVSFLLNQIFIGRLGAY